MSNRGARGGKNSSNGVKESGSKKRILIKKHVSRTQLPHPPPASVDFQALKAKPRCRKAPVAHESVGLSATRLT
jgi:hypothetical protein